MARQKSKMESIGRLEHLPWNFRSPCPSPWISESEDLFDKNRSNKKSMDLRPGLRNVWFPSVTTARFSTPRNESRPFDRSGKQAVRGSLVWECFLRTKTVGKMGTRFSRAHSWWLYDWNLIGGMYVFISTLPDYNQLIKIALWLPVKYLQYFSA